jgi:NAD(P)-dependent dehydrogenase (short-subunit alcohol dehydrogenase family)
MQYKKTLAIAAGITAGAGITAAVAAAAGLAIVAAGTVATAGALKRKRQSRLHSRFHGKVVLITGGSRGLGLALAEEFSAHGARLVLAARDAEELQRAKAQLLEQSGGEAQEILTYPCDLRVPEEVDALIATATQAFGQIDILVNNAGIITAGPVEQQSRETFHDVMNTNFFASVYTVTAIMPQMLARRSGAIVNIASIGGKVAVPHMLPYSASKFAEVGFSQGLHAELRSRGIRVLTVCPWLMRTGSHLNALYTGDRAREYRWFSLLATTPGISVSARYAARRIVRGVLRNEAEIAISPMAILASRLGPLLPGLTARAMSASNYLLPSQIPGNEKPEKGAKSRELELLPASTIGMKAARRYNQLG